MKTKIFVLATSLLCFGTFYLMFDYMNIPHAGRDYIYGTPRIDNPNYVLTFSLGDGHTSNLENIFIYISLMWGSFLILGELIEDEKLKMQKEDKIIYRFLRWLKQRK